MRTECVFVDSLIQSFTIFQTCSVRPSKRVLLLQVKLSKRFYYTQKKRIILRYFYVVRFTQFALSLNSTKTIKKYYHKYKYLQSRPRYVVSKVDR